MAATATGQSLNVSWTVTNDGDATGNLPITDSVYLSPDTFFDAPRLMGSVTENGGLAAGGHYTQNANLQLPAGLAGTFFVFVVTNSNTAIFERITSNNQAFDAQSVMLALVPPADLVAGTSTMHSAVGGTQRSPIRSPTAAQPGQRLVDRLALSVADQHVERRRSAVGQGEPVAEPGVRRQLYRHAHRAATGRGARARIS